MSKALITEVTLVDGGEGAYSEKYELADWGKGVR